MKKTTTKSTKPKTEAVIELPKLSKEEYALVHIAEDNMHVLRNALFQVCYTHPSYKSIVGTSKRKGIPAGKEANEYGYIINSNLIHLCETIKKLQIKSLMDLGCGMGILMKGILDVFPGLKIGGIDNEVLLIKVAESITQRHTKINFEVGDLTDMKDLGIDKYEALYFYEPIINEEQIKKFVSELEKYTVKGQYLIYISAGRIRMYLEKCPKFKLRGDISNSVYEVL